MVDSYSSNLGSMYDEDYPKQQDTGPLVKTPPSDASSSRGPQFTGLFVPVAPTPGLGGPNPLSAKSALKRPTGSLDQQALDQEVASIEADGTLTEAQKQDQVNDAIASYGGLHSPPSSCGSTPPKRRCTFSQKKASC